MKLKELALFAFTSALDILLKKDKPNYDSEKPHTPPTLNTQMMQQPIQLETFVKYLNEKINETNSYRIAENVLEYGMTPQRFLLTVTSDNTALFSFFLDCDPSFSAIVFTIARDYFGQNTLIGDSFLYRKDGTICLSGHDDFSIVYLEYIQEVLRRARSVTSGSKKNTELN